MICLMSIWEAWDPADDPETNSVIQEELKRGMAQGLTEPEIFDLIERRMGEGIADVIDIATVGIRTALRRDAPAMLREHARLRRGFERRIEWVWGEALDLLYQLIVVCEEAGADINEVRRPSAAESNDHRFEALISVHARACATASEIHALLRTGHARGAYARWRTLHELAVVAMLLGKGDRDLSRRFLIHAAVEEYRDLQRDEEHRERNPGVGWPTLVSRERNILTSDDVCRMLRYGVDYRGGVAG